MQTIQNPITVILLGLMLGAGQPESAISAEVAGTGGAGEMSMPENPTVLLTGLDDARSVRLSTLGNLFIAESGRHRILKVTKEGERMDSLGRLGRGDYQFDNPVAIDPSNELKVYVADRNNRRVQVFDRRMQYLSTIHLPRRTGTEISYRPSLLTVDRVGRVFFFDEERHLVYRYDSSGRYDLSFELFSREERIMPVSMDIYDEELWVADRRGELLHRFSSGGSYLGFVYAPEPVISVRKIQEQTWILGESRVQQIDNAGRILQGTTLPESTVAGGWHSFDIDSEYAFLLDGSRLLRLELEEPESGMDPESDMEPESGMESQSGMEPDEEEQGSRHQFDDQEP